MSVPRRTVLVWSMLGGTIIILAASLAWVGTHFDQARIERDTLQDDVDNLQVDYDDVVTERDRLQQETNEHVKTIEQLQAELERVRKGQGTATAPSSEAPTATPSTTP